MKTILLNCHVSRSVLAAASPTLAHIFSQSSSIEDDTRLVFTGYSFRTLRNVVEYIYTGVIEINKNEKVSYIVIKCNRLARVIALFTDAGGRTYAGAFNKGPICF